jgi:hypothetical protein
MWACALTQTAYKAALVKRILRSYAYRVEKNLIGNRVRGSAPHKKLSPSLSVLVTQDAQPRGFTTTHPLGPVNPRSA